MERAKMGPGRLQCDAGQGTGVLRGKVLDLNEQHAERIQIALDLAHGAQTDLAMLRTDIAEAIADTREALREALRGGIKLHRHDSGRYFAIFHMYSPSHGVLGVIREICQELSLDAEHAG
jgi:hypothetical protein